MDCIFCKIVKGEIPSYTVFEDEIVKVFLDVNPSTNGDLLIIPKNHLENLMDLDEKTLQHIHQVIKNLYPSLLERLNCNGLTLVQNNGYGQEIKHYHIHLTPRYYEDELKQIFNKDLLKPLEEIHRTLISKQ